MVTFHVLSVCMSAPGSQLFIARPVLSCPDSRYIVPIYEHVPSDVLEYILMSFFNFLLSHSYYVYLILSRC